MLSKDKALKKIKDKSFLSEIENIEPKLLAKNSNKVLNLKTLDLWCETFLPKTKEGELTNISKKIKNRLVDVAFLSKTVEGLVNKTGTNIKGLKEKNIEIKREVGNLIGHLCDELINKGNSIRTDYFEFIKLSPNQLKKRIEEHKTKSEPNIIDYLSYGENEIARKIETLTKTQSELVKRIQKNEQLLEQILDEFSVRKKPKKQSRKDTKKISEKAEKEEKIRDALIKNIGQKKFDEIKEIIIKNEE